MSTTTRSASGVAAAVEAPLAARSGAAAPPPHPASAPVIRARPARTETIGGVLIRAVYSVASGRDHTPAMNLRHHLLTALLAVLSVFPAAAAASAAEPAAGKRPPNVILILA